LANRFFLRKADVPSRSLRFANGILAQNAGSRLLVNRGTTLLLLVAYSCIGASFFQFGTSAVSAAAPDGKAIYAAKCAACHQASGAGGGRNGPITVSNKQYGGAMPAWRGQLSSAEIAAVLTYVRASWSNRSAAISEDQVAAANSPMAQSGAALFAAKCATCHQAKGQGSASYPPLAANIDVTAADPKTMIATIVNGRSGPLAVGGKTYNGAMPTWKGQLSDSDIAAVATYVRSSWGNKAAGVTEDEVAAAGPVVANSVGASIFVRHCASCHQASGQGGGGGTFPALAGNAHVTAPDAAAMLTTIEHGRNIMPSWRGQLSSADIAAVATYVRSAWGNKAGAVTEAEVAAIK
jgi:cbb3-type cytochrome c oxidase subunit III